MAMKFPRHLWTGEWRLESEQAREAAEEEAARRRAALAAAERDRAAAQPAPGAPPRTIRLKTAAAVALVAAAVAGGAFAAGALLHDDAKVQPLPAVSGKPIAPDKGQSRAGKIYAQASPAVVSIRTDVGSGTGFLIDRNGTLVTNAHVVGNADRVVVKFGPDGRSIDGQVKGADPSSDLAVVKIDPGSAPRNAKPLQFADSRQVQVGDTAIAIGNPFGLDRTATEGIVSGIGRSITGAQRLLDRRGHPDRRADQPRQLRRPAARRDRPRHGRQLADRHRGQLAGQRRHRLRRAVEHRARGRARGWRSGDKIARPYLGVETSDPTDPNAPPGAEVTTVTPGGPAESAGVRRRRRHHRARRPGRAAAPTTSRGSSTPSSPATTSRIRVDRSGQDVTLDATLQNRPAHTP